ncbi:MAG TPA: hypothetical protein VK926_09850 [Gaiellaceae bacterium]|nr:hypothetical protein [Gaiellaceae bacterium]
MTRTEAYAKLNLALVVGPLRADGKHEVETVMQAVELHDDVELEPAKALFVDGFAEDTLVRRALETLAEAAGVAPRWRVRIAKRIPAAAGLGGGSSDAAAALRLANTTLPAPLPPDVLHEVAAGVGSDVPFFLRDGPQLATGDGAELVPAMLPSDYAVLVALPHGSRKESTASVYQSFDERGGARGFGERRAALRRALAEVERARDLAALPANDLASSSVSVDLRLAGAFRADVTGAGPAVYGLFERLEDARHAAAELRDVGRIWLTRPVAGR